MEDRSDVAAALKEVRLIISESDDAPSVSGLAVAQFNRANAVAQLLASTDSGLQDAKELYLKALATESEIAELSSDPLAAKAYAGLCSICQALGEYDEALEHAKKAVEADEALAGSGSRHQLAMSRNALATCHAHIGEDDRAVSEYGKAIGEYRAVLADPTGEEALHAEEGLAMALNNLGMILAKMKQYAAAKQVMQESLKRREGSVGRGHESTLRTLRHLLQVCELDGDDEAVERLEAKLEQVEIELAEDKALQQAADSDDLLVETFTPK